MAYKFQIISSLGIQEIYISGDYSSELLLTIVIRKSPNLKNIPFQGIMNLPLQLRDNTSVRGTSGKVCVTNENIYSFKEEN